jgi:hypothetical protein
MLVQEDFYLMVEGPTRAEVRAPPRWLTFSTTIPPSYNHHTTSIEPTKDMSPCSIKAECEGPTRAEVREGL